MNKPSLDLTSIKWKNYSFYYSLFLYLITQIPNHYPIVYYIHCAAGIGRAPTMAAAYLVTTGLTPTEAWAKIKQVRPFIRPTPGQEEQIVALVEGLKVQS